MVPTWSHLFLLVCKAQNEKKEGILIKYLDLGRYIHEPLYIWYQCHQGNILRMPTRQTKKKSQNGTPNNS